MRWSRRLLLKAVALGLVMAIPDLTASYPADAAGATFHNPHSNLKPPADLSGAGSPCTPSGGDRWAACNDILLAAINTAQSSEHLRGFTLPSNFLSLDPAQQLFVWVNLERISRGVPPLVGLSPYLSAAATSALDKGEAPPFEKTYGPVGVGVKLTEVAPGRYSGTYEWSSFEGGGSSMPMSGGLVFALMYEDGWGGPSFGPFGQTMNYECKSPKAPGCWVDRDNLLGLSTGTSCADCVAGAAWAGSSLRSYSLLLIRPTKFPTPLSFTWDEGVLPHLPAGYERVRAPGGG